MNKPLDPKISDRLRKVRRLVDQIEYECDENNFNTSFSPKQLHRLSWELVTETRLEETDDECSS